MKPCQTVLWISLAATLLAGCGSSPTLACDSETCPSTAMTYKTCAHTDGSITYEYGSASCSCSYSNTSQCAACAASVAAYCGAQALGDMGAGSVCSIVGERNGAGLSLTSSGSNAAGTFALTVNASTTIMGSYKVAGGQITLTNSSVSPSSVQGCIGQPAVYALSFSTDCKSVTFQKISDPCQGRVGDLNGQTLGVPQTP